MPRRLRNTRKAPEVPHNPDFEDDDTGLFGFANISPKRTGLPFVIWISPRMSAGHDVQVKVSYGTKVSPSEMISVALRPEVRVVGDGTLNAHDLDLLKQWIELNFDLLLDHWEGCIEYTFDVLTSIKPLR